MTQFFAAQSGRSAALRRSSSLTRPLGGLAVILLLAGCALTPDPLTEADHLQRVEADAAKLFSNQEPVSGPISLHEAMARAVKYNLDHKLKVMESALAGEQLTTASLSMLPQMTAQAGYTGRNNQLGSSSKSLSTGEQSLTNSTSTDREMTTASLGVTWNVLDLGLSYVRAQQVGDRALITEERRRKVVHNIIQDVRSAFWNAVSADRLLARVGPLLDTVNQALSDARAGQNGGAEPPLDSLRYQRELLDTLRQLKILRRELNTAKTQLAALMNLKPGTAFALDAGDVPLQAPDLRVEDVAKLERVALLNRPELREEAYQARISHNDVRRAYLRMLPGLELNTAWNYDSNSYAWESTWWSWGGTITKNLMEVFTAPQAIAQAEAQQGVVDVRRYALSMAVMSQVHVSLAGYTQAVDEFRTAAELQRVETSITNNVMAGVQAGNAGQREAIRVQMQSLLSDLRRDLAFAEMRNAVGRLYVSLGADPLPDTVEGHDIGTLAKAIKSVTDGWFTGALSLSEETGQSAPAQNPTNAPSNGLPSVAGQTMPVRGEPAPEPKETTTADATSPSALERLKGWLFGG